MITDKELEDSFYHWLNHFESFGGWHYKDDKVEKLIEIYYDRIVDRVLEELPEMTDKENEEILKRLNSMF